MSILENYYTPKKGPYQGTTVFFYVGFDKKSKDINLKSLHNSSLKNDTDLGNKKVKWWNEDSDNSNVENIRTYLNMITAEHELIKLYVAKNNQNTINRVERLINLNNDLVHFFLSYVNKLYWLSLDGDEPDEKSGLTILQCQQLVLPSVQSLSKIVSTIMQNELPHNIISSLLNAEFEKDSLDYKMNIDALDSTGKQITSEKKKKKKKKTQ